MKYTSVNIIYNPNSTGSSKEQANSLMEAIESRTSYSVSMKATQYAGHAQKLAFQCGAATKRPLIISVSGDGGYNEVINGAVQAQLETHTQPVCAVFAAGNANDHSRTLQTQPLVDALVNNSEVAIDLLKLEINSKHTRVVYAHSYIGLGVTPEVARELNKISLTKMRELWVALRAFVKFHPIRVEIEGKIGNVDSILLTNIGEMAKIMTIARDSLPDDGLFEVVTFLHKSKLHLLGAFAKASVRGLMSDTQVATFSCRVLDKTFVQADGEVYTIEAGTKLRVSAEHKILKTLL